MALSYDVVLYTLLLYLVINIAISSCFLSRVFPTIVSLLIIVASIEIIFHDLPLGFDFPISTFLFIKSVSSKDHLVNSFALFSNLLIYSLLATTTYFVCRAQIQKFFEILGLYPMKIPSKTLWWSNFMLFSSKILHKARLPKIWTWGRSCFYSV